jgi:hypothetical protein
MAMRRLGFVSNSSSSSFVCGVCGEIETGMDMSASEFDMTECVNGHCFHNDCANTKEPTFKQRVSELEAAIEKYKYFEPGEKEEALSNLKDIVDEEEEDMLDEMEKDFCDDGVSESKCPFCSFIAVTDEDTVAYLFKKLGYNKKQIAKELKEKFESYGEFLKYAK